MMALQLVCRWALIMVLGISATAKIAAVVLDSRDSLLPVWMLCAGVLELMLVGFGLRRRDSVLGIGGFIIAGSGLVMRIVGSPGRSCGCLGSIAITDAQHLVLASTVSLLAGLLLLTVSDSGADGCRGLRRGQTGQHQTRPEAHGDHGPRSLDV